MVNALLILLVLILGWSPTASAAGPMIARLLFVVVVAFPWSLPASAQTALLGKCERYDSTFTTLYASSTQEGCRSGLTAAFSGYVACDPQGLTQPGTGVQCYNNFPPYSMRGQFTLHSGTAISQCPSGTALSSGGVCTSPCGDTSTVVATGGLTSNSAASPTCINGCSVAAVAGTSGELGISITFDNGTTVSGQGSQATQWKRTGSSCTGNGLGATEATATKFGTTASVGGNRSGGCGTFNGEYYCAGTSPPPGGGCVTTAGGQAFCSIAASAPPAPKNPTSGAKATADAVVATTGTGGTQTTNYYNATTVINGGASGGTSGGSTGGTGGTTTGTTSGSTGGTTGGETSGGTGSISGGGDCTTAPTCDGDPIGCFISQKSWETSCANRIPTVEDADAAINAGLGVADNNAPLVPQAGIFNVSGFFNPAAAVTECPEDLTIPLGTFGTVTVPVSEWCNFLHIIGLLVLASAALQSSRILLEAVS